MYIKRTKPPELIIQEMIDRLTPEERQLLESDEMTNEEADMMIKKALAAANLEAILKTVLGK